MSRTLPVVLSLMLAVPVLSQTGGEVVVNGGFEMIGKEPDTYDQLKLSGNWRNVTLGLPELFSKSAPAKTVGIPANDYGSMEPKEGDHYAGFCAWKDDQRRSLTPGDDDFVKGWNVYSEYLISELATPLVENVEYEVSFWVALSGNSDRAVMGIGAYFGPQDLRFDHRRFLDPKPQVSVDAISDKRSEWVEVKGTFVADGGERYITIGTFPSAGFDSRLMTEGLDNKYAYYYLDNITVKPLAASGR